MPASHCTKRNILSTIARIFDPIGLLAPVTLFAKVLIQKLWVLKLDWDEPVPREIETLWLQFHNELDLLASFQVPRYLSAVENSPAILVGFAVASEKGYEAMVFIKIESNVHLVCAKSEVAPLNIISIPRLELCAALLLTRLLKFVIDSFQSRIIIQEIFLFSDSTVTLNWINSSLHRWQTFVANRVTEIQKNFGSSCWFHINGLDNLSDCLSRGLTPAKLVSNTTWSTGPAWLQLDSDQWPIKIFKVDNSHILKLKLLCLHTVIECNVISQLISKFSSWRKLINCVYILRFIRKLPTSSFISSTDLKTAELYLVRLIQKRHFNSLLIESYTLYYM